jgi:hypothetical protein
MEEEYDLTEGKEFTRGKKVLRHGIDWVLVSLTNGDKKEDKSLVIDDEVLSDMTGLVVAWTNNLFDKAILLSGRCACCGAPIIPWTDTQLCPTCKHNNRNMSITDYERGDFFPFASNKQLYDGGIDEGFERLLNL